MSSYYQDVDQVDLEMQATPSSPADASQSHDGQTRTSTPGHINDQWRLEHADSIPLEGSARDEVRSTADEEVTPSPLRRDRPIFAFPC
ncbi:hypothetical protein ColLi_09239 [Colletotrichum liriopes]|uniref:Uncharacterized protein n=1 Tax=Colletotrichum liriopes TaxID=708192 RepID=A0AA37GSG2_9PEZI|nr:hypothetical protein ColLi_09239 [Colletotrichum liriopes]